MLTNTEKGQPFVLFVLYWLSTGTHAVGFVFFEFGTSLALLDPVQSKALVIRFRPPELKF